MSFQLYEIFLVQIEYRLSKDIRPCVIIDLLKEDRVKIARISSATDLFNSTIDFFLSSEHNDFSTTGLKKNSYISGAWVSGVVE